MGLSFANPAAMWGLLGIPAVLLIHFLQSRNRPEEISTLFLLELLPEESRKGAVITHMRNSLQLWMHLFTVLLATLLLSQPMWTRPESVQSIAVVLDSSVAMRAFQETTRNQVGTEMRSLARAAARTEWWVLASEPGAPTLYRGDDTPSALAALDAHQPMLGVHESRPALARARDLVGPEGLVLWVTPFPPEAPPAGAVVLGVGEPLENGGFTGIRIRRNETGGWEWVASLLHHGEGDSPRRLQVAVDDRPAAEPSPVTLSGGSLLTLRGELPSGTTHGVLRLDADDFDLDDVLPFVVPEPKVVRYQILEPERESPWSRRILEPLEHVRPAAAGEEPTLAWATFSGSAPESNQTGVFVYTGEAVGTFAEVTAEDHPLTEGLAWSGFLGLPHPEVERRAGDQVLVWMGATPLVVLRETGGSRQLILAFNPEQGNARRLPAAVLTLHRFVERVRASQPDFEAVNLHTHQRVQVAAQPEGGDLLLRVQPVGGEPETRAQRPGAPLRAPAIPSFFEVEQDGRLLLRAAVAFADSPSADLTRASSQPLPPDLLLTARERHSHREWFTPLWFALLGMVLFGGWWSANRN